MNYEKVILSINFASERITLFLFSNPIFVYGLHFILSQTVSTRGIVYGWYGVSIFINSDK